MLAFGKDWAFSPLRKEVRFVMFKRSLMCGRTLTNVRSQPRDLEEMEVVTMMPRPALSIEWTALRSASKSLCWDAKFLTSDLKCGAVSTVIRPRQTKVNVPSREMLCSMVRLWSEARFVGIQIPPKRFYSHPPSGIRAAPNAVASPMPLYLNHTGFV